MADALPKLSPQELDRDQGTLGLTVDVVMRSLGILFVFARLYARRRGGTKLWWDDWLIIVAGLIFIPCFVIESMVVRYGLGRHLQWVIQNKPQPSTLVRYSTWAYADELTYSLIVGPIKTSILCLYIRIFGVNNRLRWACIIQIVLVVIWALVTFLLFTFQCNPVQAAWSTVRKPGQCFQYRALFMGTNVVNVVMDFGILITPLPCIWRLQLETKRKLWVCFILVLGAGTLVFSMIRLVDLVGLNFIDTIWDETQALIWSVVEASVGVICACIPVLGPLLPRSWIEKARMQMRGVTGPTSNEQNSANYSWRSASRTTRQGWSKLGTLVSKGDDKRERTVGRDSHELSSRSAPDDDRLPTHEPKNVIRQTVEWDVRRDIATTP